ncbi:MAG: 5-deoxy-glucuronate isomerase [Propionibacteriales bacterium]|nr:5-deoxy-glucuronate isomerase [Propionibacteriales bacterium]
MSGQSYHLRRGETAEPPYDVAVTPETAGWGYSGLAVLSLVAGEGAVVVTGEAELLVMSLTGGCTVTGEGVALTVTGRESVFSGPSDFVYVPRDASVVISSTDGGRFALPSSRCTRRLPMRHQAASDVPVELRGAGQASRQVNNLCTPAAFEADKLIACEVLTPGGNWSSYPPHKHDEQTESESQLEEIYYFEVAPGPGGPGMAYQRVYGHDHADIDVLAEVRTGDVVLIPHGWHGPSMAVPGYDLYYLNVMAGPGRERAWKICDDPAHGWVRATWDDTDMDPRLPFTATGGTR